jgi:hypothetical protein
MARVPSRAPLELRPDVAPYGAQDSSCYVLSHGWLAVGHPTLRDRHYRGSDFAPSAYSSAYAPLPRGQERGTGEREGSTTPTSRG